MTQRSRKQPSKKGKLEVVAQQRVATVGEVALDVGTEFRELMVRGGLALVGALFQEELVNLCGPRYARGEALGSRWGTQQGEVVLGGRKVKLRRPRVRKDGEELVPPLYRELQSEDPLSDRALEQMLIGVSTRKYHRSLEPVIPDLKESGTSKSAVSRRFVARTKAQLETALAKPLDGVEWAALMIDGITFHEHVIVIALGIDTTGKKHVLSFRQGSTENGALCREMLSEMVARGVPADTCPFRST